MDEDSGGILFKLSSDPRGWSEHSNADWLNHGIFSWVSSSCFQNKIAQMDFSNKRKCFVSEMGESCGGTAIEALHNSNGVQETVAAGVEWHTSLSVILQE